MQALKQSTATTILVGPVLDSSGTAVTTAVLADFNITKNGTTATLTGATVTHSHNGHYTIALTTGNTDTLGRLTVSVNNTAMAMAPFRYTVLTAAAFDTLVTNGTLAGTTSGRTIAVDASGFLTVATNNDKTGYSLTQSFPSNFSSLAITAGGAVTAGTVSDKTGYSLASGGLSAINTWTVAITGNITGNLSGSVGSVTGRVTANTDQWNGVTVTGMPMPTYTQPTGFLAATFPTTVASTTNITAASGVSLSAGSISSIQSGLATETTLSSLSTKFGGITLVKNWLAMIMGKTADTTTRAEVNATTAGATYNETTDSLEAIRDRGDAAWTGGGGGGGTVNVLPASGVVADRAATTTLKPVVGETVSQSITVYQSDGTTAYDLSGKTLAIVFETLSGTDVAVVDAADITISGTDDNIVTFAYPSAVTASVRTLAFAIRDAAAPKTMYLQGVCSVVSAPTVDT